MQSRDGWATKMPSGGGEARRRHAQRRATREPPPGPALAAAAAPVPPHGVPAWSGSYFADKRLQGNQRITLDRASSAGWRLCTDCWLRAGDIRLRVAAGREGHEEVEGVVGMRFGQHVPAHGGGTCDCSS